jgi:molecular chaperone HscB
MTPDIHTQAVQVCRACGSEAPLDAHFCPSCKKILGLGAPVDYFSFLGLPRKLNIEPAQIEQRFRTLSREFHPDYFYNASPSERRASLERSSYLNDAYRTLKQPASRVSYLLQIEGVLKGSEQDESKKVPASLLEEVFALNEELDEVRARRAAGAPESEWRDRLAAAAAPIERKRAEHESQLRDLSARWDALDDSDARGRTEVLNALRERVLERNYINNLLATIDREATGKGGPEL